MKKSIFQSSVTIILALLIVFLSFFCFGCEEDKKSNPYENKVCIECGRKASHYASGPRPTNGKANSQNTENINGAIYRIFYCDQCWNRIPTVNGDFYG